MASRTTLTFLCAAIAIATASADEACVGMSAALPPAQCAAYRDFFDAAGGNDWFLCERTRLDPCSCDPGSSCNSAGTALLQIFLEDNNMVGTLPSSMSNLVNLTSINIAGNYLTGPVPELPWSNMRPYLCQLIGRGDGGRTNLYDCPLPAGALALPCQKSAKSGYVPMVATDCGPLAPTPAPAHYKCVNSTCVAGAEGVALHKCQKACG